MDLQAIAMKDAKNDSTPAHIKAALMRAWCDLQERINELRGIGKPRPVTARNERDPRNGGSRGVRGSLADRLSPLIMPSAPGPGPGPDANHPQSSIPPTQVDSSPEVKPDSSSTPEPIAPGNNVPN